MQETIERSELQTLLNRNISTFGLSPEDYNYAEELIRSAEKSKEDCCVCTALRDKSRVVLDTSLCSKHAGHARYALNTGK